MNRLFLLAYCTIAMMAVPLFATNHMDLLTTMSGEFGGAALGRSMCSIDFNGDGIDDLVAVEANWNPTGSYNGSSSVGRISFYWGGPDIDNASDFSISGTYVGQYCYRIVNAGDINNDGIEDLCYWGSEQSQEKICIFYGRQNPVATPDVTLSFPHDSVAWFGSLFPLGDVNNDNHADIGYVTTNTDYQTANINVLNGATLTSTLLSTIFWPGTAGASINGIGDVNNDGVDDFHRTNTIVEDDNTHSRLTLYYGGSSFPYCDSLLISPDTNSLIAPQSCPLGDVNGDGIDDFASFINSNGARVWFGSDLLTAQWDFVIPLIFTQSDGYNLIHGDLNNDGYEDIIGTNYRYDLDDGIAYVWLGGHNPNGTVDLTIPHSIGVTEQFGWAKAAGDFNNDGFCDVAISQPYAPSGPLTTPGRIFIYLGNAQLADTTVAVEDETVPSIAQSQWEINIHPNPLPTGSKRLCIEFSGEGYEQLCTKTISLYNLKGQRVFQTQDSSRGDTSSISLPELPSGVYIIKVSADGHRHSSKRIVVY